MRSNEGNYGSQEKKETSNNCFLKKKKKNSERCSLLCIENLNVPFDSQLLLIPGLIVCKDSFVSTHPLPIIYRGHNSPCRGVAVSWGNTI